jgi:CysZ protein
MILTAFLRALGQIGDPRFRRVLGLGVLLSLALLVGVYALFLWGVQALTPESVEIPFVGPVGGLHSLLSWASLFLMLGLSVFLMVPVASAFCGLFLDEVVEAVEARHYPALPPVSRLPWGDALIAAFNLFALLIAVNLLALFIYPFVGPAAPLLFWAVNGYLLGFEYFGLVAQRRLGREGARALRRRHRGTVWLAGALMAAPLSVPLVNLLIPVLGAATFTHIVHGLALRR